ncbi:MAG TPA: hypothetical protein VFN67_29860 [Polyangiales bacterium]|nr:hypothetical protein [Polyangiales bacterium]
MALTFLSSIALERAALRAGLPQLANARIFAARFVRTCPEIGVGALSGSPRPHPQAMQIGRSWIVLTLDELAALEALPREAQKPARRRAPQHIARRDAPEPTPEKLEQRRAKKRQANARYHARKRAKAKS